MLRKIKSPCEGCNGIEIKHSLCEGGIKRNVCPSYFIHSELIKIQAETAWAIVDWLQSNMHKYASKNNVGYEHERNRLIEGHVYVKKFLEAELEAEGILRPTPIVEDKVEECEDCNGTGYEICNNPDHGFIDHIGGETERLGCPVCGHDPECRVLSSKCPTCDGKGRIEKALQAGKVCTCTGRYGLGTCPLHVKE